MIRPGFRVGLLGALFTLTIKALYNQTGDYSLHRGAPMQNPEILHSLV